MNIKEIAKLAGVSTSTISKIVNQKDESISRETREHVLKIVKEYNYIPHSSTALSAKKTWTLGVLLRSSVSFDPTLNGIIQTAQENGYATIVCNSCLDTDQELKNITSLCRNNVDGIIWEPVSESSLSFSSHMEGKNIPVLTTGPYGGTDSLTLPYEELGYRLTQELIDLNHSNIACLLTEGRRISAFLSGYKKCLFDNHMPLDEELICTELTDSLIYKINTHRISGLISSHYTKALEFYHLTNALHYRIPEDFSLITIKNDRTETLSFPQISSYTVQNQSFGEFLGKKLLEKIERCKEELPSFTQAFQLDSPATIGVPFNLKAPKITVVGSINMDVYLNVSHLPDTGKTVSTSTSSVYPGGKGINQSIGAAKLGHRVTLIGNVGSDPESDEIYKSLNQYGVDSFGVKRCADIATGKAYIFVEPSGASTISILSGANDSFSPTDILEKEHLFENTGYCLLQSEVPLETIAEACRIAHKNKAKTILKPSARSKIPQNILSKIDILIPNKNELNELCPACTSIEEAAAHLLKCGINVVIVTLGEQGCYVRTHEWEEYIPAAHFTPVDNTGASDAFISALASYLLNGYELKKAVRIATYAAGFCISREGVVPALIDKNSLETYIRQKEESLLL